MSRYTKLELTWIGKDDLHKLEPRILIEDTDYSHRNSTDESDMFNDNLLIYGDNLLALKALEQDFTGEIRCIYIDPPFNTGQAFEHYDDGIEHSLWLSLMRDRLEILVRLLADDGAIFVHIDDNELGRLSVLMDEMLGAKNRISIITFKQGAATGHKAINPGPVMVANYILAYAKDKTKWKYDRVYAARNRDTRYSQFVFNRYQELDQWKIGTLNEALAASLGMPATGLKKALGDQYEEKMEEFVAENADSVIRLARPSYDAVSSIAREVIDASRQNPGRIYYLEREGYSPMYFIRGERILFYKDKLKMIDGKYVTGEPITNIWDDLLSNNLHNEGGVDFPKGKKPEALIKRILDMSTKEGDWVLDSFAGSGTTAAVAHKMRRRWITVELGEHAHTHCLPRLRAVINGTDPNGVTKATSWIGGGGFRYMRLAPSLLQLDKYGNWVISREYNATMLARAMCKLEGFKYAPSETVYWKQGRSSDRNFIFTTTQRVTHAMLEALSNELGDSDTLLVCCTSFTGNVDGFHNITVKKIPKAVLDRCEWGHDDYSFKLWAGSEVAAAYQDDADVIED